MIVKPKTGQYTSKGPPDWNEWLKKVESNLKERGYHRYDQHIRQEDFAYWKTISAGKKKIYQIGCLFYDFRKYVDRDPNANRIGVMYQCTILCDDRIDLTVSKDIDVPEFEEMSKKFYKAMTDNGTPLISSVPQENIAEAIEILKRYSYGKEEMEECGWDANKIDGLDATAFDNACIIRLLGGHLL